MRREVFMGRVRAALGGAERVERPTIDASLVETPLAGDTLGDAFVAAASAVGVDVIETDSAGVDAVVATLCEADPEGTVVTAVTHAICETGSLVLHTATLDGAGLHRMDSLACRVHVAIVQRSQLVPTLLAYLSLPVVAEPGSRIVVTGPSKTADIEGVLITGVHGPGRVVAVLIG